MKEYEFNFDLELMKESIKGPYIAMPNGLTRDTLRKWINAKVKRMKDGGNV